MRTPGGGIRIVAERDAAQDMARFGVGDGVDRQAHIIKVPGKAQRPFTRRWSSAQAGSRDRRHSQARRGPRQPPQGLCPIEPEYFARAVGFLLNNLVLRDSDAS